MEQLYCVCCDWTKKVRFLTLHIPENMKTKNRVCLWLSSFIRLMVVTFSISKVPNQTSVNVARVADLPIVRYIYFKLKIVSKIRDCPSQQVNASIRDGIECRARSGIKRKTVSQLSRVILGMMEQSIQYSHIELPPVSFGWRYGASCLKKSKLSVSKFDDSSVPITCWNTSKGT